MVHDDVAPGGTEGTDHRVAERVRDGQALGIVGGGGVLERALRGDEQLGELSAELHGGIVAALDARLLPLDGDAEQQVGGEDESEGDRRDGRGETKLLAKLEPIDGGDDPSDHSRTLTTLTPLRSADAET